MSWAAASDVRDKLLEMKVDTSYWSDDLKVTPHITLIENQIISQLGQEFTLAKLQEWQADSSPPGVLVAISAALTAAEIMNVATMFRERNEATISRIKKEANEQIARLKSGEDVLYDEDDVEWRADVSGGYAPDADDDQYDFDPDFRFY